jgi:hypothetical protein
MVSVSVWPSLRAWTACRLLLSWYDQVSPLSTSVPYLASPVLMTVVIASAPSVSLVSTLPVIAAVASSVTAAVSSWPRAPCRHLDDQVVAGGLAGHVGDGMTVKWSWTLSSPAVGAVGAAGFLVGVRAPVAAS